MGFFSIVNSAGTAVDLASINVYIERALGIGMPPIQNIAGDYGLGDGALFQRQVAKARVFTLVCYPNLDAGATWTNLHSVRKDLIALVQRDRSATPAPIEIRYTANATTVAISAWYDGGLEFGETEGFTEKIALRFYAPDPFWQELTDTATTLTANTSLANSYYHVRRASTGLWDVPLFNATGETFAFTRRSNGSLIASVSSTVLNPPSFSLGNFAGSSAQAYAMAVDSNGDIYVGGLFTSIGGVSATNIAKYTQATGIWSALSTGVNGRVRAIAVDSLNRVYIGGDFTTAGGVAIDRFVRWDGSSFTTSLGGISNTVYAIAVDSADNVYVGGDFVTAGGVTVSRVARLSGTTWTALGGTTNGAVRALAFDTAGYLYAGGAFTSIGGVAANRIARWNQAIWSPLGSGFGSTGGTGYVQAIAFFNGEVYAGGTGLNTAGGLDIGDPFAIWTGSAWQRPSVELPGTPTINAMYTLPTTVNAGLYIGYNTTGSLTVPVQNTVTNNGDANAYPVIAVTGPGVWYELVNSTTGDRVTFSGLTVGTGEVVTLDLRPGYKTLTSSTRGDLGYMVADSSNEATWKLMPGANTVLIPISDPTATIAISYRERYWSADGGAP